jgi:hypothetical protein
MTTTPHPTTQQLRTMRLVLAGAAAAAVLALFNAAHPDTTVPVRLADAAQPAPASGPFGGFAADNDDDQAQQQAQLQEQLALQEMQQSQQLAEQQNEAAQQQVEQDMQQAQTTEQQANIP